MHDVAHGSWVRSVLHRSCATFHNLKDLSDLSDLSVRCDTLCSASISTIFSRYSRFRGERGFPLSPPPKPAASSSIGASLFFRVPLPLPSLDACPRNLPALSPSSLPRSVPCNTWGAYPPATPPIASPAPGKTDDDPAAAPPIGHSKPKFPPPKPAPVALRPWSSTSILAFSASNEAMYCCMPGAVNRVPGEIRGAFSHGPQPTSMPKLTH